jgi:type II secretory pathway pseudopilin PulG
MQARSRIFTLIELLVVTAMMATLPWLSGAVVAFN